MPQFELDHGDRDGAQWFKSLDSFTQGYVEAMFFTIDEELSEKTVSDLDADSRKCIAEDCRDFQKANEALLDAAYATDEYEPEQAGRDFWFTRNRHGVGYWDREPLDGELGQKLSAAAQVWPEYGLYEGDDGALYLG